MTQAFLCEIFPSIQGEGLWIGERHIFVRFFGCDLRCCYCDTPDSARSRVEDPGPASFRIQSAADHVAYERIPNPVSVDELTAFCKRFLLPGPSRPTISLTGGEPLLHASFLAEWLPHARQTFRIYLETNGIHAAAMRAVRDLVDVVSMDFKLPSSTRLGPFWDEHGAFLSEATGKALFVKAVVTNDTVMNDITTAARIIAEARQQVPLVLQPAAGRFAPATAMLLEFQRAALSKLDDVRVIPQAHKILNVP
jgi:organic radical activating enzyme